MGTRLEIKIGNRFIGNKHPCFIVAEIGVNHNGSKRLAKKAIDLARAAGVDAVKFQVFKAEDLVTKCTPMAEYQIRNTGKILRQYDMLKGLELDNETFIELKEYCDRKGLVFLATPHTESAIDFLDLLVPAYKVASGDLTNTPFLKKISRKKKPIILSTGMSTFKEINQAVAVMKKEGNSKFILLHCTSAYPCPFEEVNLKAMENIKRKFNCLVGYSDHTLGNAVAIMAVTMGASILEKHFTLDKDLPGPDHKTSLEPEEFKKLVTAIRDTEKAFGSAIKKPTISEKIIMKLVRKSLTVAGDIPKGAIIKKDMLAFKRPGIGIQPRDFNKAIGKRALRNIKKGELLTWGKIK